MKVNLSQLNRNILSGTIVHGLNILIAFISYPLYIHYLGMELFSVWVLLSVIITVAQFGDFGIGNAVINFVAAAKEEGRLSDIKNILFNSLIIIISVSVVIQLSLWIFNSNIIKLLNIPAEYVFHASYIIPFIGISIFTFLMFDIMISSISGIGRIDISNMVLLSLNFFKICLTIFLLYKSPSLESMVYGVLIANCLFLLIPVIVLVRLKIPLNPFEMLISKSLLKKLFAYGMPVIGVQVVNIVMFPFIKIIISRFFNIEYVGFFELATKAAYAFRTLFEKGLVALFPEFSRYASSFRDDVSVREKLKNRVAKITKINLYGGSTFLIILALFSAFLLKLWLGKDYNDNIYYGYLILQPGIIVGLVALPSFYALLAIQKQYICLMESIIRLSLTLIVFQVFFLTKLNYLYVFLFISFIVVLSNGFVLYMFFKKIT